MNFFYWLKWRYYDIRYFVKSKYQKVIYGYEFRDAYNLSNALAEWVLPRIRHLRNNFQGVPIKKDDLMTDQGQGAYTSDEWRAILDSVIFAFEFILEEDDYLIQAYPKDHKFEFHCEKDGKIVFDQKVTPNYNNYNAALEKYNKGIELFKIHLRNLWD